MKLRRETPAKVADQRPTPAQILLRILSNVGTGGAPVRPSWHQQYAVRRDELAAREREDINRQAWLQRNLPDGRVEMVNPVLGARRALGAGGSLMVRPDPEWLR